MTLTESQVEALRTFAARNDQDISALGAEQMARALGLSRSALYRTIGTKAEIVAELARRGVSAGDAPLAHERVVSAAQRIIREQGVQSLTIDAVAAAAGVAVPTVYGRFRNRAGLMVAVFDACNPVPQIVPRLSPLEAGDVEGLWATVHTAYGILWDFFSRDGAMVIAIYVEMLRSPSHELTDWLEQVHLPRITGQVFPWLARAMEVGLIQRRHPASVGQMFFAPIAMSYLTRSHLQRFGLPAPERDQVIQDFTDMFLGAVTQGAKS